MNPSTEQETRNCPSGENLAHSAWLLVPNCSMAAWSIWHQKLMYKVSWLLQNYQQICWKINVDSIGRVWHLITKKCKFHSRNLLHHSSSFHQHCNDCFFPLCTKFHDYYKIIDIFAEKLMLTLSLKSGIWSQKNASFIQEFFFAILQHFINIVTTLLFSTIWSRSSKFVSRYNLT